MNADTAKKLAAVYDCLTSHIVAMGDQAAEFLALPMLDLENVVNEANGERPEPLHAPARPSKTH